MLVLPSYAPLDISAVPNHTVSGLSAGASVAVNHLVAFSRSVQGAGITAGSPYGCNILPDSDDTCGAEVLHNSSFFDWEKFQVTLAEHLSARQKGGLIDPVSNLRGKPVYLYSGTQDTVVNPAVMHNLAAQLKALDADLLTEFSIASEHAWIVDNMTCSSPGQVSCPRSPLTAHRSPLTPLLAADQVSAKGQPYCGPKDAPVAKALQVADLEGACCGACRGGAADGSAGDGPLPWWHPPVNHCPNYDMSGAMFRKILGGGGDSDAGGGGKRGQWSPPLARAVGAGKRSNLHHFNQTRFFPSGATAGTTQLAPTGFIYVPDGCKARPGDCRPHVHYHCCAGSYLHQGVNLMMRSGLLDWAEPSRVVVVFPQVPLLLEHY
jgi:hypothetical protein